MHGSTEDFVCVCSVCMCVASSLGTTGRWSKTVGIERWIESLAQPATQATLQQKSHAYSPLAFISLSQCFHFICPSSVLVFLSVDRLLSRHTAVNAFLPVIPLKPLFKVIKITH